jgi:hypothetical protein
MEGYEARYREWSSTRIGSDSRFAMLLGMTSFSASCVTLSVRRKYLLQQVVQSTQSCQYARWCRHQAFVPSPWCLGTSVLSIQSLRFRVATFQDSGWNARNSLVVRSRSLDRQLWIDRLRE